MTTAQFDLFAAKAKRDTTLARVASRAHPFIRDALLVIRLIPVGNEVTGEDVRRLCTAAAIQPKHPNAWGVLIRTAISRRLILPTGVYRSMTDVRSNARKTPVYRRIA